MYVCVKSHILKCVCLYFCRWDRFCERRNLSSRSRVEPTYTLTSVLFFSSEQIIVVQEWLFESNILYLYPNNKCSKNWLYLGYIFDVCLIFTLKYWTQIFGHMNIRQLRHVRRKTKYFPRHTIWEMSLVFTLLAIFTIKDSNCSRSLYRHYPYDIKH